jgi:hypothetical protein
MKVLKPKKAIFKISNMTISDIKKTKAAKMFMQDLAPQFDLRLRNTAYKTVTSSLPLKRSLSTNLKQKHARNRSTILNVNLRQNFYLPKQTGSLPAKHCKGFCLKRKKHEIFFYYVSSRKLLL